MWHMRHIRFDGLMVLEYEGLMVWKRPITIRHYERHV